MNIIALFIKNFLYYHSKYVEIHENFCYNKFIIIIKMGGNGEIYKIAVAVFLKGVFIKLCFKLII